MFSCNALQEAEEPDHADGEKCKQKSPTFWLDVGNTRSLLSSLIFPTQAGDPCR